MIIPQARTSLAIELLRPRLSKKAGVDEGPGLMEGLGATLIYGLAFNLLAVIVGTILLVKVITICLSTH